MNIDENLLHISYWIINNMNFVVVINIKGFWFKVEIEMMKISSLHALKGWQIFIWPPDKNVDLKIIFEVLRLANQVTSRSKKYRHVLIDRSHAE